MVIALEEWSQLGVELVESDRHFLRFYIEGTFSPVDANACSLVCSLNFPVKYNASASNHLLLCHNFTIDVRATPLK